MAEEGIVVTRSSVSTTFTTVTESAFMIATPPGIAPLWDGDDVELVNREISGAFDATYPPVIVGGRRALTAIVCGDRAVNGAVILGAANQRAQLKSNMKHLHENVIAPVASAPGIITVKLLGPAGTDLGTKNAQIVGPMRPIETGPSALAITLDFLFTAGVFAL